MYFEVVEDSWDVYISWFFREVGNVDYQESKDGEINVIEAYYQFNEIGYMTVEYENDEQVKKYFIQIENQYFQRFCKW